MKRRVAPRLLTALIATVLVASAAMPGAALAETPDSTTPETSETPASESQQRDTTPAPSPEATVTPPPAPTSEKPSADNDAPSAPTPAPSPTVEKPETRSDDDATPAESDVMPDGPLKFCITPGLAGKEATLAETEKLTSVSVDPSCALPGGTPDPSNLPAMDDWKGARFLSGVTALTVTGFDGVTVPRDGLGGLAKVKKLSLANNQLTKLPDLGALPELESLDLADNDLTELTMPSVADAPRLTELNVSENQISDVSEIGRLTADQSIDATGQKLTHPDITARATQQLADVITVPDAWTDPSWKPGENQMAAVNGGAGTFSAARPGAWSLSWTVSEGKVSFSGSTTGDATAPESETISFTRPGPVEVGESATYRADVSNLPAAVRSELDYQWYRGGSTSRLKPVDGATDQVFIIDSVSSDDDGSFVKLVAEKDGAEHDSTPVVLRAQPKVDFGLERCLDAVFPGGFTTDDLDGLTRLDCSDRGIVSLDGLKFLGDNASVDLSSNLITDISSLTSGSGASMLERFDQIDLSDNLISDVSVLDLADLDLSAAPNDFLNLDGNRISNVKVFEELGSPPGAADRAAISIQRQIVGVGGVDALDDFDVPGFEGGREGAINVAGDVSPLSLNQQEITESPRKFLTAGLKELTWGVPVVDATTGVAFSGAFVVPVGLGTSLDLTFSSTLPTGGDVVTARAYGFEPGETITFKADNGEAVFRDQTVLSAPADASGMLNLSFTIGYLSDTQRLSIKATGGISGKSDTFGEFTLYKDEVVPMPDADLRACVNQQIGELPDATTYRTRLNKITTDFSCLNKDVKDLTGLEAIAAPRIDLSGNDVSNLETLNSLDVATTSLTLANNELAKVGKIDDQLTLESLETLDLSKNRLRDLSELEGVTFAEDSEIIATDQTITLGQRVVGQSSTIPVVAGIKDGTTDYVFPEDDGELSNSGRSFTWTAAGNQRIDFDLEEPGDESSDSPAPGLQLAGSFLIRVVSAPPEVQPPSEPPARQAPPSATVQTLAPKPLAERVQPENDDPESPRAVALGPEVALEEASPPPRTVVTNPTVEKRDPITSQAGWGLTATGWSLLGAALLAMALAVGIAVLTLGRSTR